MAQLTITINNNIAADVRDTLCIEWGYAGDPSDNTAKLEFVRSYVAQWIKAVYRSRKATIAGEAAVTQSNSDTSTADIA